MPTQNMMDSNYTRAKYVRYADDFVVLIEDGEILVIETKIGTANDSVVGQILGYMNAIRQDSKGQKVRGLIIAEGFTDRVKYAVKSDDIRIKKFYANLEFQDLSHSGER